MRFTSFMMACILGIAGLLTGCTPATTEINSFTDPDFGRKEFQRLLVAPRYEDLGLRARTEDAFARELATTDAEVVPSMGVLLPTREVSDADLFPLLAAERVDAVLLIRLTDVYQDREFVPERVDIDRDDYLTARQFRPYRGGGYARGFSRTRVTRSGGYFVEYPRVRHELMLYDVATKRMAWRATTLTSGESNATQQQMVDSFAKEVTARLMVDGILNTAVVDTEPPGN